MFAFSLFCCIVVTVFAFTTNERALVTSDQIDAEWLLIVRNNDASFSINQHLTVQYERRIGRYKLYVFVGAEHDVRVALSSLELPTLGSLTRNRRIELGPGRQTKYDYSSAAVPPTVKSKSHIDSGGNDPPLLPHDICRDATGIWHLLRINQKSRIPKDARYCAAGRGNNTHVFVVDTGVASHVDFRWPVRQDYDFFAPDKRGRGDFHGHGTHVAGLVASQTYGVAPSAVVHNIAVLNSDGVGSLSTLAEGLLWVLEHAAADGGVVQMSLGALDAYSGAVAAVLDQLRSERRFTAVASAGNLNVDACRSFPGQLSTVVTVAAIDSYDRKADFSNDGPCVDILAPGVALRSLSRDGTGTIVMSGTSMSAPLVSGAVLLLRELMPHAQTADIVAVLLKQATAGAISQTSMRSDTPNRILHVLNEDVYNGASSNDGIRVVNDESSLFMYLTQWLVLFVFIYGF